MGSGEESISTASTTTLTDIKSRMHGLCLDVPYSQFESGIQLWMWGCNGSPAQLFTRPSTTPWVNILIGGKCLEAYGTENGTPLRLWDCDGSQEQLWWMDSLGRLTTALAQNKCADIWLADWSWGARIVLHDCHGGSNQQWTIGKV
jgi:hypothetical protein